MADTRKDRRGKRQNSTSEPAGPVDESSPMIAAFRSYGAELDTKHDRHERLVKLSRDVTIESKRIIFLLHRATGSDQADSIMEQARDKLQELQQTKFREIASELDGQDPYQFLRAYSPGVQEYIEAVSFHHYLKDKTMVTLEEIRKDLVFTREPPSDTQELSEASDVGLTKGDNSTSPLTVFITPLDYMLGIADLTGELMRLCINSVGVGNLDVPFEVCDFMRSVRIGFVSFGNLSREISRKVGTLRQSMQKIEMACYTLRVRGSEIPKHMLKDAVLDFSANEPSSIADD